MVIKFDSADKPNFVTQDLLLDDPALGQIIGFYISNEDGDTRIKNGDFIIQDRKSKKRFVVTRESYDSDSEIREEIREEVGKEVNKKFFRQMDDLNLTDVQDTDLINRVLAVLVLLNNGNIGRAKKVCNGLVVGGQLTQGRKNFLISRIDDAINIIT